jgi:hypothetical protein
VQRRLASGNAVIRGDERQRDIIGNFGQHWFDDVATEAQRITFIGSLDGQGVNEEQIYLCSSVAHRD